MRFIISAILSIPVIISAYVTTLDLGELGCVRYTCEDGFPRVDRLTSNDEVLYTHTYHIEEERLTRETLIGDIGEIYYIEGFVQSPYHFEACEYDGDKNLVRYVQDNFIREYTYTDNNELISPEFTESFTYDNLGNLRQLGKLQFSYDGSRLVKAEAPNLIVLFSYDSEDRLISKSTNGINEHYGYLNGNQIARFDHTGKLIELRIPGFTPHPDIFRPIAIETQDAILAPIIDRIGNISKLVDIETHEVISLNLADPYGRGLSVDAPTRWNFSGKPYLPELDLVYFGARYYSPQLGKWLTPDPLKQTPDLHQYCLNNPLTYTDPNGEWAIVIPLVEGISWTAVTGAALTSIVLEKGVEIVCDWWREREKDDLETLQLKEYQAHSYSEFMSYTEYGYFIRDLHGNEKELFNTLEQITSNDYSTYQIDRSKKGSIDPTLPSDPENDVGWEDISHPLAKENGHFTFRDRETGKKIEFDKGKPGESGHKSRDHFHHRNPNRTGDSDHYLDGDGRPVAKGSEESHLYPPK